jgi:signal transduction histidine kinase/ActR/RegA family two-component response regulator
LVLLRRELDMREKRNTLPAIVVAALGVLAAWGTRLVLAPWLDEHSPFITFFPMVFAIAWWGGLRPTLFATLLSALLISWVVLDPKDSFAVASPADQFGLVVFVTVALATGWLGERLHFLHESAQQAAEKAIGEREQLSLNIAHRKRAEESVSFLAHASNQLAVLADRESALQQAVRLPIPYLADWCVIYVVDDHGAIDYHAHAHRDPGKEALLAKMLADSPLDWTSDTATVRSLRSGESQLMPELPEAFLDSIAQSEEHRAIIRELGPRGVISVPLKIRERVIGVMGIVSCESARQYSQREVRLAESLAERISTAVDNARLFHAVKEASRQKDEFLAMLAHELRNPLAAIRYALELGQLSADESPAELFDVIDRQTQNLAHLIDDLLDVSRISRNKVSLRREYVDLATILNRAVAAARPLIEQKHHELILDIEQKSMPVFVDATRAEQIIANLLTNAAKYTKENGRVTLRAFRDDGAAVIKVMDTGIGMPPEMLGRVFDLFTQADRTLDRSEGGLGIGLTVARKLAEMHGGNISAASEGIGQGSTFTVRLPLAEAPAAHKSSKPARPAGNRNKYKILVVDDNRDTAKSCALLLKLDGHDVETAYDGLAALKRARALKPQVLFLDIGLPGMNGYDVAKRLRKEGFEHQVMVAVSGYGQLEDRQRSHEAGFDHHLVKPVDQLALTSVLENLGQKQPVPS